MLKGGAKGAAYGLGVSLPGAFILNRRWHYYRALPPNLKALSIVMVAGEDPVSYIALFIPS